MSNISAVCLVVPPGEVLWMESPQDSAEVRAVVAAWKDQNPEYSGCSMGMVEIRMPADKYRAIPGGQSSAKPHIS